MKRKIRQDGFTLVELAIVLIIIGVILAAVLKGEDLIRSARIKQYSNQFVKGWEIAYYNYQDRTGRILGDSDGDGWADADTDAEMDTVCNTTLPQAGLTPPVSNTQYPYKEHMSGKYVSSTVTLYIDNLWLSGRRYNVLDIRNVPTDIAIALDAIIDGNADANSGSFQQVGATGDAWPDPQTTKTVRCAYTLQ